MPGKGPEEGPAPDDLRCPICGVGRLRDLTYDEGAERQEADSRQLQQFTCGHEVTGARLSTADTTSLDVEQRQSEETVNPPES
jgi:hypothetical protein